LPLCRRVFVEVGFVAFFPGRLRPKCHHTTVEKGARLCKGDDTTGDALCLVGRPDALSCGWASRCSGDEGPRRFLVASWPGTSRWVDVAQRSTGSTGSPAAQRALALSGGSSELNTTLPHPEVS
jgi:hypothetical protein